MNFEDAKVDIANIINNHRVIVDRGMINFFEHEFKKNSYSSYEYIQALALEYSLRQAGLLEVKHRWRHDWAYSDEILIDLKRRPMKYQNTSIGDPMKIIASKEQKMLTHFVIYSTNKETDLTIGDELTFKFEDMIDVETALSECIIKTNPKNGTQYALFPPRNKTN